MPWWREISRTVFGYFLKYVNEFRRNMGAESIIIQLERLFDRRLAPNSKKVYPLCW